MSTDEKADVVAVAYRSTSGGGVRWIYHPERPDMKPRKKFEDDQPLYSQATITALQERINELEGALAEKWQDIATAPKQTAVIVYCDGLVGEAYWKYRDWGGVPDEDEGWWWANTDEEYGWRIYPTHWQPLPAPPTLKDRGNGSEVLR